MPDAPRRTPGERHRRAHLADMAVGEGPEWHDPAPLPAWLPPSGVRPVRLAHADAVAVPRHPLGEAAINLLGDRCGPVIADTPADTLMWLVPADSTRMWRLRYVSRYRPTARLHIPAADLPCTWFTYWRVPPHGDCLTDASALHDALAQVIAEREALEAGQ